MYVENNMCNFIATNYKMHYIVVNYDLILCVVCQSSVIFRMGMQNMVVQVVEFSSGGTKFERFLSKNQHTRRNLLKFENWCNGEVSKCALI